MAKPQFNSVDEYIDSQPEAMQPVLRQVRAALRQALPGADENIAYNMPAYELNGVRVLQFAGWKQHYSLYGASSSIVAAFPKELAPYAIQKGTISFPSSQPVPAKLIQRIAKFRAKEVSAKAKATARKKAQPS